MKRLFSVLSGAALFCGCAFFALSARAYPASSLGRRSAEASPQVTDIRSSVDSVPQTAVVPVQQAPVRLSEHTTVYEVAGEGLNRVERRALRAKNYAACIDSLVQSHDYMFYPATMQEMPDGRVRSIYADYFFFGLFVDHVEIHLPVDRAASQYFERLNFDSMAISNYQVSRVQCGWMISFNVADGDTHYHACFNVSTATGETILTLITPSVTMRYTGRLDSRFRGCRPERP
ncbi:MAG: hypothetical protein K2G58_06375 [Alistipes sp.]|nr:hypothetical protein [Alistipes sp.]